MMRIEKGSHRLVFIFERYVFKFPRLDRAGMAIAIILKTLKDTVSCELKWRKIKRVIREFRSMLIGGIIENKEEYRTWKTLRADFLARIVFGSRLMNVQVRCHGQLLTSEDEKRFKEMKQIIGVDVARINPHWWDEDNFLEENGRIVVLDYGDGLDPDHLPLKDFLVRHRGVLQKFMLNK